MMLEKSFLKMARSGRYVSKKDGFCTRVVMACSYYAPAHSRAIAKFKLSKIPIVCQEFDLEWDISFRSGHYLMTCSVPCLITFF